MFRLLAGGATVAALAWLSFRPCVRSQGAEDAREPALEFRLELEGQREALDVRLDEPFEIPAGSKRSASLRAVPTRHFVRGPIQFRYPREFVFEHDASVPEVTTWTLQGNTALVTLTRYAESLDPQTVLSEFVGELTRTYGRKNASTSPIELKLGGRTFRGTRVDAVIAGTLIRLDTVVFQGAGRTWSLCLQDTPEDGKASDESRRTMTILGESFVLQE